MVISMPSGGQRKLKCDIALIGEIEAGNKNKCSWVDRPNGACRLVSA